MEFQSPNSINEPNQISNDQTQVFCEDFESTCSTPYVSAPSSPGRGPGPINGGFFYSAPASPMHFAMTSSMVSSSSSSSTQPSSPDNSVPLGYEFEFSARFGFSGSGQAGSSMSSADELFLNGQIRPMKLSTHLEKPQVLAPLLDLEHEEEGGGNEDGNKPRGRDLRDLSRLRDKSLRRRTRSMSPLRSAADFVLTMDEEEQHSMCLKKGFNEKTDGKNEEEEETYYSETSNNASMSASSSRSSSAGRSSKRWVFLKDFLRSKSEGRSNNKFWSTISFSPNNKEKKVSTGNGNTKSLVQDSKEKLNNGGGNKNKPVNGIGKRRIPPSPHELHYTANRAQAEEMRKKTFLPYRQGLLGCLGFSSKGYGAMNGLARALNPVSSR